MLCRQPGLLVAFVYYGKNVLDFLKVLSVMAVMKIPLPISIRCDKELGVTNSDNPKRVAKKGGTTEAKQRVADVSPSG